MDNEEEDLVEQISELNTTASKGPLAALLTPAFTIFGDKFEEWAIRVTGKKMSNIETHIEKVKDKNPQKTIDPTPSNNDDFIAWTEEAARYDDGDDFSFLWQGILDEILNSKKSQKIIIEMAKQIDKNDLDTLIILKTSPILRKPDANISRLERLGFLSVSTTIPKKFIFFSGSALIFIALISWINAEDIFKDISSYTSLTISGLFITTIVGILYTGMVQLISRNEDFFLGRKVSLSDKAMKIVRLYTRYKVE